MCSSDVKLREISSAGFSSGDEDEDDDEDDEYSSTVSRVRPIRVDDIDDDVSLRDTELHLRPMNN